VARSPSLSPSNSIWAYESLFLDVRPLLSNPPFLCLWRKIFLSSLRYDPCNMGSHYDPAWLVAVSPLACSSSFFHCSSVPTLNSPPPFLRNNRLLTRIPPRTYGSNSMVFSSPAIVTFLGFSKSPRFAFAFPFSLERDFLPWNYLHPSLRNRRMFSPRFLHHVLQSAPALFS